jgi:hypothetical protein
MQSVQAPEDEEQSLFWLAAVAAARILVTSRHRERARWVVDAFLG